jgi:hypothetical protein
MTQRGDLWIELPSWLLLAKIPGAGVALGVYIHRGFGQKPRYNVVAVETPIATAPTLRAVLENHAQMVIASDLPTLSEAKNQGEEYIERWRQAKQQGGPSEAGPCMYPVGAAACGYPESAHPLGGDDGHAFQRRTS